MTDRDHGCSPNEPVVLFAPVESRVHSDGTEHVIIRSYTLANDEQTAVKATEEFRQIMNLPKLTTGERRSLHVLSSEKWTSPWDPPHKPINHQSSKDPHSNNLDN